MGNWLQKGVVTKAHVEEAFARMAAIVGKHDEGDKLYTPMDGKYKGAAYKAAIELVFKDLVQPSGYTEPLLHAWRLKVKAGA